VSSESPHPSPPRGSPRRILGRRGTKNPVPLLPKPPSSRLRPAMFLRSLGLAAGLAALALAGPGPLPHALAQTPSTATGDTTTDTRGDWNDARVRELMARAHASRRGIIDDEELRSYRALTQGHIYFFVDPEEGERSLIRVDQVAVDLLWKAPDIVRQQVVGERSEVRLPVRDFRYYLDRLTLVQYGFGDEIQVGSGMDVAGVPHPLAVATLEGEDRIYDYRIVDAVELTLAGRADPIRLLEVEVRPVDPQEPRALGTLLLDEGDGSLVRMELGFTAASYVDRRTDRITVEVDYGLWEGRYWLPNRQVIDVRREVPDLDLGVGTVIRTVLRVGNYELNADLPPDIEFWPPVSWRPEAALRNYPFEEPLLAGLERDGIEGMEVRPDPRRLRSDARRRLGQIPESGLAPFRFHIPQASSLVRYNRAEGLYLGLGSTLTPSPSVRLRTQGGFAFAPGRPVLAMEADGIGENGWGWRLAGNWNHQSDLGLVPAAAPLVGSLAATFLGEDYLDPIRRSGVTAALTLGGGGDRTDLRLEAGLHRDRNWAQGPGQAPLDRGRSFRPIRPVEEGTFAQGSLGVTRPMQFPGGGTGDGQVTIRTVWGMDGEGGGVAGSLRLRSSWSSLARDREVSASLVGRAWAGDPLAREHRLMGGRSTLPGYPFREWGGQQMVVLGVEGAMDAGTPFFRIRGGLHAGMAGGLDPEVASAWGVSDTGGIRPSVSLGLGMVWDLLRIDGARGLREGEWQLLFSVDPRWWDRL